MGGVCVLTDTRLAFPSGVRQLRAAGDFPQQETLRCLGDSTSLLGNRLMCPFALTVKTDVFSSSAGHALLLEGVSSNDCKVLPMSELLPEEGRIRIANLAWSRSQYLLEPWKR